MDVLPDPIIFEWDKGNHDKNFKKHNISNQEAEEVFINDPKFILSDRKHSSEKEARYMLWGRTNHKKAITIIFTIRNEKIRIISCRDMHKKERREYESKS
ncbi:BrnT family toxin [Patescibacteria group bacterium]|nr:BrnT family toxin [Patescibacteria group bacterium]MBU4017074.1 BrnT family toxin [Patescibacteria group bacterium]MBU4098925.1 BrnT family toxin [Patescibacteria group bacterium]